MITPEQQAAIEETRSRLLVYLNAPERRTYADVARPCGLRPDVIRDFVIGTRPSPDVARAVCQNLPLDLDFTDWRITPA